MNLRPLLIVALLVAGCFFMLEAFKQADQKNSKPDQSSTVQTCVEMVTPEDKSHSPTITASSSWSGWAATKAMDGDLSTSWFSARSDSAAHGKEPWIQLSYDQDRTVHSVTISGNREERWSTGYSIILGKLEVRDKDGNLLKSELNENYGAARDLKFDFKNPVNGVRTIRFISVRDQGKDNPHGDIAIAEIDVQ